MKSKYIFWGNVLLGIYSSSVLIFYIMKLFVKESSVYYFISYDLKSLFLILLLHFIYWVGAGLYLFKKNYLSNLVISFGAIGFLVTGVADCFFVSSYNPAFYSLYFAINLFILITIGGSLYKNVKFTLFFVLLWIIITALSYSFLNSLLII